jgi:hypothetical protein
LFIVKPLKLLMVQWLPKMDLKSMIEAIKRLCVKIESRGYAIKEIVTDPAKQLAGLEGKVAYNMTTVGSRTHVADAEVEIRTVKERLRASTAGLPYNLTTKLVKWQVYGCIMTYNILLRQGQTVSSRELFTGVKPNYSRDLRAEFGEYVQAHVVPSGLDKSGPKPRTVGAIALMSADNNRGTWWFMGLKTGGFFKADRWDILPMPDIVIELMNQRYDKDQQPRARGAKRGTTATIAAADNDKEVINEENLIEVPHARDYVPPSDEPATEDVLVEEEAKTTNDEVAFHQDEEATADDATVPADDESNNDATTEMDEGRILVEEENANDHDVVNNDREDTETTTFEDDVKPTHTVEGDEIEHHTSQDEPHDGYDESEVEPDEYHESDSGEEPRTDNIVMQDEYAPLEAPLGARIVAGVRRSHRIESKKKIEARVLRVYRLSVQKALKKNEAASKKSILKELRQIVDKDVWEVIDKAKLTKVQLKKAIRSSMFLKEKFTSDGEFEKLKARLVAGGDKQDKTLYDDLSSPTVAQETVMMVLAIAAIEGRKIATMDITGAYLECEFPDDDEVIMTLDPLLTKLLTQIDASIKGKQDERGVTYVRLRKALYGCVQSAKLWYDKLCEVLAEDGYSKNDYDPCLFNKTVEGQQVTVAFHVDDLLVTSENETLIDQLQEHLENTFEAITVNRGNKHSYLAMNLVVTDSGIQLDMIAYIEKCLKDREFGRKVGSPATEDLFEVPEDSKPLSVEDAKVFHSHVAKLLYLAKRTRGQILTAVSHLSGRVMAPTEDDQEKLKRIFTYLASTKDEVLMFKSGGTVDMEVYIDASYGVHADGSSRTGMVVMMAGLAIGNWSSKQKLVTKSSTEAEIVGLSDGLTNALWMREMLIDQGYALPATVVYQDNEGVIKIIKKGRSPKHRTRHLNVRHFFARDRENSGDIKLVYKKTSEMIADIHTKPLSGWQFKELSNRMTGND